MSVLGGGVDTIVRNQKDGSRHFGALHYARNHAKLWPAKGCAASFSFLSFEAFVTNFWTILEAGSCVRGLQRSVFVG